MRTHFAVVLLVLLVLPQVVHAEDWTVKGRTYQNIRVIKVNPDTVSVTYDGGTGRLNLSDLTPNLQLKFKEAATEARAFAVVEKNADTDPIAHLVVSLSGSYGMWMNGACFIVRLPKTASPEDLASNTLPKWGYTNYKILKVERIQIPDSWPSANFTEILFHAASTDKILVLAYQGVGWWSRPYDSGL